MKNITVSHSGKTSYCAVFGRGETPLLLLPGLGDGLRTVKGSALPLSLSCRELAKKHTVYALSRANELQEGCSTADMAQDAIEVMDVIGIGRFDLFGVSMGGMIAQHIAAMYPERIRKTVLAVTAAKSGDTVTENISRWIGMAGRGEYRNLMTDTAELSYSERYLRLLRPAYPFLFRSERKDMRRFIIMAEACAAHDASDSVGKISCPTLVIGGGQDMIVGRDAAETLASAIDGAELYVYPSLGHGLYDEAKDFYNRVSEFLTDEGFYFSTRGGARSPCGRGRLMRNGKLGSRISNPGADSRGRDSDGSRRCSD